MSPNRRRFMTPFLVIARSTYIDITLLALFIYTEASTTSFIPSMKSRVRVYAKEQPETPR